MAVDGSQERVEPTSRHTSLYMQRDGRALVWSSSEMRQFDLVGDVVSMPMPVSPSDLRIDEQAVLVLAEDGVEEWPLLGGGPLATSAGAITDVDLSPDGELLAVVGWAGRLLVLDAPSGEVLLDTSLDPKGLRAVDWSSDGTRLVVGGRSGRAMAVGLDGEVQWRSERREAIAMDAHAIDGGVLIGWEDGKVTRRRGERSELLDAPIETLWALAPGEPLVSTGRGNLDPSFVSHDGRSAGTPRPAYGIDRRGSMVAVGTGHGLTVADLAVPGEANLEGPALMDVAILDDEVVLGAGYDGRLHVWVKDGEAWRASHAMPLGSEAVLTSVITDGQTIWVGDSEGVLHGLRLHDGPLITRHDALRHGLTRWLEDHAASGLDAVRSQTVLGREDRALEALASVPDGPAATLWGSRLRP